MGWQGGAADYATAGRSVDESHNVTPDSWQELMQPPFQRQSGGKRTWASSDGEMRPPGCQARGCSCRKGSRRGRGPRPGLWLGRCGCDLRGVEAASGDDFTPTAFV